MKVAAIVVAAGQGARMGSDVPKVFLEMGGAPILLHVLRALSRVHQISEMVVVVGQDSVGRLRTLVAEAGAWPYPVAHAVGGNRRQDSVAAGLAVVSGDAELVVVHDGARPFVPAVSVIAAIEAAAQGGAAILAVPARDTVKLVDDRHIVTTTPTRDRVWLAQTPQVFRSADLREAHARARRDGVVATDDATLVERLGVPIQVIAGDPANLKITTPDDLRWAEWYLQTGGALR